MNNPCCASTFFKKLSQFFHFKNSLISLPILSPLAVIRETQVGLLSQFRSFFLFLFGKRLHKTSDRRFPLTSCKKKIAFRGFGFEPKIVSAATFFQIYNKFWKSSLFSSSWYLSVLSTPSHLSSLYWCQRINPEIQSP